MNKYPCVELSFHPRVYLVSLLIIFELIEGKEWGLVKYISQSPAFYKHFVRTQ